MREFLRYLPEDSTGTPTPPEAFIAAPPGMHALFAEDPSYEEDTLDVRECTIIADRLLGWLVYREFPDPSQTAASDQLTAIPVTIHDDLIRFGYEPYTEVVEEGDTWYAYPQWVFLGLLPSDSIDHAFWLPVAQKLLKKRKAFPQEIREEQQAMAGKF